MFKKYFQSKELHKTAIALRNSEFKKETVDYVLKLLQSGEFKNA